MNILVAKVIVQQFVDDFNIEFFENSSTLNFYSVKDEAEDQCNEEMLECLEFIASMGMIENMFRGV